MYTIGQNVNYRRRTGHLEQGKIIKIDGNLIHLKMEDGWQYVVHEQNSKDTSWDWIEPIK